MKVIYIENGLIIEPETDFEINFIESFGYEKEKIQTFIKTGLSANDMIGLKIIRQKENK